MTTTSKGAMPLVLAALCAAGPLGIDMYLPSLPDIAQSLGCGEGAVQLSLMTFFIGLMLGQLVYGPLSDKFGRKPLITLGLAIFVLGSLGCTQVVSIEQLQLWRFIQGLGGSIGMVLAFAIVRDAYSGPAMGKMIALVLAVLGLSPVVAPLIGNALQTLDSWRSIFWALAAYGVLVILAAALWLPETRDAEHRKAFVLKRVLSHYRHIAVDRKFIPFALSLCIAQAGFFAYIAGSASVFISQYQLSPTTYSLLFGMNALGLVLAAGFTPVLHNKLGHLATYRRVLSGYFGVLALLLGYLLLGGESLYVLCAGLFLTVTLLGVIMPTGSELSLMQQGRHAGTASALMGAMQFGAGALISLVTGALTAYGDLALVAVMLGCALLGGLVCLLFFPRQLAPASAH
jgi:DHA1 family bicyclomycin/chloramphenicol resistance-like MFS transporter